MKMQERIFLASILDGVGWSASCSGRIIFAEKVLGIRWIEDWFGHRAGVDVVVNEERPNPCRKSNPNPLVHSQLLR
jgi:hypothetical protein